MSAVPDGSVPATSEPPVPAARHSSVAGLAILTAGGAVLLGLLAYVGLCVTSACPYDVLFLLDNAWRVIQGQHTHADFSSAWGPVTYLVSAAGLGIAGLSPAGLGYVSIIVGSVLGVWAFLHLRTQVHPTWAGVSALHALLVCVTPNPLGWSFRYTATAMNYNRWAFVLLFLIVAEAIPRVRSRSRWQGASTGAALAVLLFLKASFFFAGLGVVAVSLVAPSARSWPRLQGLLIGFVIGALPLLFSIDFAVAAMLSDLRMAAISRSLTVRPLEVFRLATDNASTLFLLLAAAWTWWSLSFPHQAPRRQEWLVGATGVLLLMGTVFGLDVLLRSTNAQTGRLPLTELVGVLLAGLLIVEARRLRSMPVLGLVAASIGLAAWPIASDLLSIANAVIARSTARGEGVYRIPMGPDGEFVVDDRVGHDVNSTNTGAFLGPYVQDGLALLRTHASPGERITTFDAYNPFPYLRREAPPKGGMSAAVFDFTYCAAHHLSPEQFFGEANLVMRPRVAASNLNFAEGLESTYAPALERAFEVIGESEHWRLYRRRRG